MRITKTRLMRGPTINPNPPICKSKEPSYTLINIYSCADDHKITTIEHYNWNWTQAHEAANGGIGTYTLGYFYEAAFKKYTDLSQRHCIPEAFITVRYRPGVVRSPMNIYAHFPGKQGTYYSQNNYPDQPDLDKSAQWVWSDFTYAKLEPPYYSVSGSITTTNGVILPFNSRVGQPNPNISGRLPDSKDNWKELISPWL